MSIGNSLNSVQKRITDAALKSGRNPDEIKLISVSKKIELARILEAVRAGAQILGENRVQEADEKMEQFRGEKRRCTDLPPVEWHLIGTLQKNKARHAVRLFDLIHSVDSVELAEELDRQSGKINKTQRFLIQIKLSDEPAKHGIAAKDVWTLLDKSSAMENLKIEGFMTMPPFFNDPEHARPYFRKLRELARECLNKGFPVHELSMGMSNDFEVAIEEGSTMVRVGTAIFGERLESRDL